MADLTRDDIRAAVSAGMIDEAQAASILTLSEERRGVREHMSGLDEPFELFRGFNEIFIVVGLLILYSGWLGVTGIGLMTSRDGLLRGDRLWRDRGHWRHPSGAIFHRAASHGGTVDLHHWYVRSVYRANRVRDRVLA